MAENKLLPVYLIDGSDEVKRQFVLDRLVKRVSSLGNLDFNKDTFNSADAEGPAIVNACETLPFASPYRLVIVKDIDKAAASIQESLVKYLDNPNPTTVLALTSAKLAKNKKLYKVIAKLGKQTIIDCNPKSKKSLPNQVVRYAEAAGVSMDLAAATDLIAMVGESTTRLDTEVKKIALALGRGAHIGRKEVHEMVARTAEVKPWDLTDAMFERDPRKVEMVLKRVDLNAPFGSLSYAVRCVRELLYAKGYDRRNDRAGFAADLKKSGWLEDKCFRQARNFTAAELREALISAADAEKALKTGADPAITFERWVLGVTVR